MEKDALLEKLGKRIRDLRKQQNITQAYLAHTIGKDQQSVQRLEAGKINPSYIYLQEIANGLGCTIEEIVKTV